MPEESRRLSDDQLEQVSGGMGTVGDYCPPGYVKCPNPRCTAYTAHTPYKWEDLENALQLQYFKCAKCGYEWTEVY